MRPPRDVPTRGPAPHGGLLAARDAPPGAIDFSSSVSPAGPPPAVRRYLRRALADASAYPDPESGLMRAGLARYAGVPASCIVAGNGATELIYCFCRAALRPGSPVLIPAPTFGEYEEAARLRGCRVSFLRTDSMAGDIDRLVARIPARGCVFLCNPNNPTGELLRRADVVRVADAAAARSSAAFVDECFIDLASEPAESVASLAARRDGLFVLRSLTKSFALAGLRAGYGVCTRRAAAAVHRVKVPWSVSGLAQGAAAAAVADAAHLRRARRMVRREAGFLRREISRIPGFECRRTDANFMLVRTRLASRTVRRRLLAEGILVRDCSSFRGLGGRHIRVAVRARADNRRLVGAMRRV